MDYIVVTYTDRVAPEYGIGVEDLYKKLEKLVNEKIQMGYKPIGSITTKSSFGFHSGSGIYYPDEEIVTVSQPMCRE